MNILLISLHTQRTPQAVPLAAANLMAALPAAQRETTRLLDLFPDQPFPEMLAQIRRHNAKLIAFSTYLWNRETILALCRALKSESRPPFLLLGGPEASADSKRLLQTTVIDAVLRGEGEHSFSALVETLLQRGEPEGIAGLCTLSGTRQATACSCDLTRLPSPWVSLGLEPVDGGVLWEVARGCSFNCSFCYDAKGLAGVRPFPQERLVAELEYFVAKGAKQVWVLDASFNVPARRGKQLLKLLHATAPRLHYHLEAKAEFIDAETVKLLSNLSCSIQLGLQTADSEVLARLKRKIDVQRFWQGVERVAVSPLTFGLDLIYGLPGDSCAGFIASLETALKYRPNQVDIFPLAVLPGTELYSRKSELALQAPDKPPYQLEHSRDFSALEMMRCQRLKVATDLFYNRGRAVGFFLPLCAALKRRSVDILEDFAAWLEKPPRKFTTSAGFDDLSTMEIFGLQKDFLKESFRAARRTDWWPLVEDVLQFHFGYAETLLGEETLPNDSARPRRQRLILAPGVRLIHFHYEILGALESEEIDLARWHQLLEPGPSYGLMIRRGGEVLVEELTSEFNRLLQRARSACLAEQLVADLPQKLAAELLDFAWQEGLLLVTT